MSKLVTLILHRISVEWEEQPVEPSAFIHPPMQPHSMRTGGSVWRTESVSATCQVDLATANFVLCSTPQKLMNPSIKNEVEQL